MRVSGCELKIDETVARSCVQSGFGDPFHAHTAVFAVQHHRSAIEHSKRQTRTTSIARRALLPWFTVWGFVKEDIP